MPRHLPKILLASALVLPALGGCDSTHYQNVDHPNSGDAEYKTDLAQCRQQNSKLVVTGGYEQRAEAQIDEAKVRTCMTERGWQAISR